MIKNGITILSSLKSLIAHVKQPCCFSRFIRIRTQNF